LRRVIRSEGTSRAWINGRPVTLTQLNALGERLVEIHGQHEHQSLLGKRQQLALLDAFGRHASELHAVVTLANRWRDVNARIAAVAHGADRDARLEWLRHQLGELDQHALAPEQLSEIEQQHRRLANAGQLVQGCAGLADLLDGDGEFTLARVVARAQTESQRLGALDPKLAALTELLEAARIQIDEAGDTLTRYQNALDLDPQRLADIDAQLGKLHELARKHRVPMSELKAHAETLREEWQTIDSTSLNLAALQSERDRLRSDYASVAAALSTARDAAARQLGEAVTALLGELGMGGGHFEVALERNGNAEPDIQGVERCEFLVSANPGQPLRALRKVASGGELSRISLAIEVAAIGLDDIGTMVFDEVDSGIGGAVAEVVGQKLRRLGSQRQVLCVTHLAQVAAQGHAHLQVIKSSSHDSTETRIEGLGASERRNEIARMLGGVEISRETLAHAKQMLQTAQARD
ncbi:MAG: DNA repair protein RecN, partial [Dokdonella sp.]